MALSKTLLLGLGVVGGAALFASRRRAAATTTATPDRAPTPAQFKKQWDPICSKYPSGSWAAEWGHPTLRGFPRDKPGWSEDDIARVLGMITDAIDAAPAVDGVSEARETTFQITRDIIAELCPGRKLPKSRATVENHLRKSIALRWMWQSIDTMVWQRLMGLGV